MNIALDAMGGDFAPRAIIEGALLAKKEILPEGAVITLVGKEDVIKEELKVLGAPEDSFLIVHADEVIEMAEHPTKAISAKRNASIPVGYGCLRQKK